MKTLWKLYKKSIIWLEPYWNVNRKNGKSTEAAGIDLIRTILECKLQQELQEMLQ